MLADRKIALRVNGLRVTKARVRRGKKGLELIITDSLLGVCRRETFRFGEKKRTFFAKNV